MIIEIITEGHDEPREDSPTELRAPGKVRMLKVAVGSTADTLSLLYIFKGASPHD